MTRRGRGFRRANAAPSALGMDALLRIPGLKAWFDSRSDAYLTLSGSAVTTWTARSEGSLGAITLSQSTAGNKPTRATAVASLNGKNAILFDGTDDYLDSSTTNGFKFLHDGTGGSMFAVLRIDSTAGTNTRMITTANANTEVGIQIHSTNAAFQPITCNGSGTTLNAMNSATSALFSRDVSRWLCWSYATNSQQARATGGVSVTQTDTGGQAPSSSNPGRALRVGATISVGSPFKGYIAQLAFFDHVLTAGELAIAAGGAAREYGVAA